MLLVAGITSCKKNNAVVDKDIAPPTAAEFLAYNNAPFVYYITSTNDPLKIPVGFTTVSGEQRTMQFTYTSKTAAQGVQYNAPASMTFAPNKVVDSLTFTGLFSGYPLSTRVDTVIIRQTGQPAKNIARDSVIVILRKYCNVILTDLAGDYTKTYEGTYGPYTSNVSNVVMVPGSTTKATAKVSNIYDSGIEATVTFDWTNKSSFNVTLSPESQATPYTSGGLPLMLRLAPNTTSTFSSCEKTVTLRLQLYTTAGVYDTFTMSMAK